ncbi:MAG: hypothetical protein M3Q42_05100 [Pseudomonadota bacterium]|nr:hypothetical protein [Pseudomonadota bacterium]
MNLKIERFGDSRTALLPESISVERVAARLSLLNELTLSVEPTAMEQQALNPAAGQHAMVFALGSSAIPAAIAYASACGRPLRQISKWQEVLDEASSMALCSAFVFLPEEQLTVDALSEFSESACDAQLSLGFLPLPADPEHAIAASLRLVALSMAREPHPSQLLFFAESTPEEFPQEVFRDASRDDFFDRASAGADAIVFAGHGNGACFKLGTSALCVIADDLRPAVEVGLPEARMLPCQAGGPCLQRNLERKRGASALNGDLLVFMTCWGWMAHDGYIDQRMSFAHALLKGRSARSIVAPFGVSVSSWFHGSAARDFLLEGGTAGQLALALNDTLSPGTRQYLCIGDPEVRIAEPSAGEEDAEDDAELEDEGDDELQDTTATEGGAVGAGTFLVRRMLEQMGGKLAGAREVLALLESPGDSELASRQLLEFMGAHAASHGGAFWKHHGGSGGLTFEPNVAAAGVHVCGARWWASDSLPHPAVIGTRRHYTCSRCGVVGDIDTRLPALPILHATEEEGVVLVLPDNMPRPIHVTAAIEASGDTPGAMGPVLVLDGDGGRYPLPRVRGSVRHGVQGYIAILTWPGGYSTLRLSIMLEGSP